MAALSVYNKPVFNEVPYNDPLAVGGVGEAAAERPDQLKGSSLSLIRQGGGSGGGGDPILLHRPGARGLKKLLDIRTEEERRIRE